MRLATVAPGGWPHVAAFWFHFDGTALSFATVENVTVRNLRDNPRATALVDLGEHIDELRGVTIKGEAQLYRPREAPVAVKRAIHAIEMRYPDEIASPAYQAYLRAEKRHAVFVTILPLEVAWYDLGLPYRQEQRR